MAENILENIYYLGPDGSNAHNATLQFLKTTAIEVKNHYPQKSIRTALETAEKDYSSICVLPIENSIEGIVRETIDNLVRLDSKRLKIQGEITLPIKHLLLSTGKEKSKIKKVMSHPQALSQCSRFLHENFPDIEIKEVSATSYAAQKIASLQDDTLAALANETCAKIFNLNILSDDINDEPDNKTRFYILSDMELPKEQNGKTAIILSVKNVSGALCEVLKIFAKHDINLSYIDSRPSRRRLGEYLFFMEMDGYETDCKIRTALEEIMSFVDFFRILGSFQKF